MRKETSAVCLGPRSRCSLSISDWQQQRQTSAISLCGKDSEGQRYPTISRPSSSCPIGITTFSLARLKLHERVTTPTPLVTTSNLPTCGGRPIVHGVSQ